METPKPSAISLTARPALAPRVRLQTDAVTGHEVLLYPEGILELNDTAHEIILRCDGHRTVEQIVDHLCVEYDAPREVLLPDVLACLEDMRRRQLVQIAE